MSAAESDGVPPSGAASAVLLKIFINVIWKCSADGLMAAGAARDEVTVKEMQIRRDQLNARQVALLKNNETDRYCVNALWH